MSARKVLFCFILNAATFNTIAGYDWLSKHYFLAERYNCAHYLEVFFDRAVIFKYGEMFINSWAGNADFDCTTSVYSRTKGSGIISVIQKMKFRVNSECVDYIKTSESEREKCGEIIFGMKPTYGGALPSAPFVSKHPGPFLMYSPTYAVESYVFGQSHSPQRENIVPIGSAVEPSTELRIETHIDSHAKREDIHIVMAMTSYRTCEAHDIPEGWFNCGYGMCIGSVYVNDGVVNCPFGDCIDEGGCKNAMDTSPFTGGFFNASASNATQGLPNPSDSKAMEDSSELETTASVEKDWEILLGFLLKDDKLVNIVDELRKHNEILDGIYKMLEIMAGMMTERKDEVKCDNCTSTIPLI